MESKGEKLQKVLLKQTRPVSEAPPNVSQEVYQRRLAADIARTRKFIQQANSAVDELQQRYGDYPEVYDEHKSINSDGSEVVGKNWSPEIVQKLHLLALHEVYKQMPYQPMKNDSIGIATALTLTSKAVSEQASASDQLQLQNETKRDEISELKAVLDDYKLANDLIKKRINSHPERVSEIQAKIDKGTSFGDEVEEKLQKVTALSALAKSREDSVHRQLQKVVMKLYAMMDWENAHLMDEDTFKKSIASSVTLVKALVSNLLPASSSDDNPKWISVIPGSPEERLVEVMMRNNILLTRDGVNGAEVRLRAYGLS